MSAWDNHRNIKRLYLISLTICLCFTSQYYCSDGRRGDWNMQMTNNIFFSSSGAVFYSPLVGFSLLAYEVSWSHNDAPQSVGLLWTNDQSVATPDGGCSARKRKKERRRKVDTRDDWNRWWEQNIFTFTEPRIVVHTREKDQQDAHFLLIIYFNEIILDVSNKQLFIVRRSVQATYSISPWIL